MEKQQRESTVERVVDFLVQQLHSFQGCGKEKHLQQNIGSTKQSKAKILPPLGVTPQSFGVEIPYVLNKASFYNSTENNLTPNEFRTVFCGISKRTGSPPPKISFELEPLTIQNRELQIHTMFDIDSVLALPKSLAVAKRGLRVFFFPPRHLNIQQNLHIQLSVTNPKTKRNNTLPIHKIPHLILGRIFQFTELNIFIFFPNLYHPNKDNNFLTDKELERFYDSVFFPAVYECCPPDILQHLPSSMEKAKLNAHAAGTENRSRRTKTSGATQLITYLIAPQYLDEIWIKMKSKCNNPGLHDFKNMVIMLDGKDLKLITKKENPTDCFNSFLDLWSHSCDNQYLDPKYTWLDYGKEYVEKCSPLSTFTNHIEGPTISATPITYLWRKCCLRTYNTLISKVDFIKTNQFVFYQWALSNDTASMSFTPTQKSVFRKAGLVYSQFYTITHEIFNAAKTYPFQNDALEGLAVDPHLKSSWYAAGGGSKWEINSVQKAYQTSKMRCHEALKSDSLKSYGIREEHRITMSLLFKIIQHLSDQTPKLIQNSNPNFDRPFWAHPTTEIFEYLKSNINKFAFGFEYTMGLTPARTTVSWEHTRLMVMFLRILKFSYGGGDISREAGLWRDKCIGGIYGDKGMEGMAFQKSLQEFGYPWLPSEKIDWRKWNFSVLYSQKILFNNNSLHQSYKKRWGQVKSITDIHNQLAAILNTIKKHSTNKYYVYHALLLLSTNCIINFRKEVWSNTLEDFECDDMEDCLLGKVGMSVEGLRKRVVEGVEYHYTESSNKFRFSPLQRAEYLWCFNDGIERNSWENKPFRLLFKQIHTFLDRNFGISKAKSWATRHCYQFLEYNWVLPHPVKTRFYQRIYTSNHSGCQERKRIWYSVRQIPVTEWKTFEKALEGSGRKGDYQTGEPKQLPLQNFPIPVFIDFGTKDPLQITELKSAIQDYTIL